MVAGAGVLLPGGVSCHRTGAGALGGIGRVVRARARHARIAW
jgi:hypothetical protein